MSGDALVAPSEAAPGPPEAALGLHKGIAEAGVGGGCSRWPSNLRLESTLGELVPGRCKATNLCDYCARLAAVENAEVLAQDALSNSAPAVWSVLGTRSTVPTMRAYRLGREAVTRAVQARWRSAERATLIEFTTGYGARAGGARRPHWNDLWKGVPVEDVDELRQVAAEAWCRRVDAELGAQFAGAVSETGGLMRYLALHFQKESQQPSRGWRGHRFSTSRGYLGEPMAAARERARAALRLRRELWRARQSGLDGQEADDAAQRAVYEAGELAWTLVRVQAVPTDWTPNGEPASWVEVVLPVRA